MARMRPLRSSSLLLLVAAVSLAACSSSSSSSSSSGGPTDGGGTDSGGTESDAGSDAGTAPSNCTTFTDHTADGDARTITWVITVASDPNRCMKIKAGQTVTWDGDLTQHPLGPNGGDTPNPVSNVDMSGKVTFPNAGTFGFKCEVHPAMIGAIQVVP